MPKNAFSLTNLDDKNGLVMTQNTRSKVYTYSLRSLSDFKGKILESHFEGMLLDFNNHELAVHFIGRLCFKPVGGIWCSCTARQKRGRCIGCPQHFAAGSRAL